jgi:CRISPR-associated protein Csb1
MAEVTLEFFFRLNFNIAIGGKTMSEKLTLERLESVVESGAALRCRRILQPAGGLGDKVFPPTYEGGQYAHEDRIIDGQKVPCVLLDSVQSQANRMELALLEATRSGKINVPLVEVDFAAAGLPEVGTISSLEAPHRIADAILRDSRIGDVQFRESEHGSILNTATVANATELFGICPTALIFGIWDSTGPLGGLGTKFQRTIVSSITAVNAEQGVRPSSRIDPLNIHLNAGPLYKAAGKDWTLEGKNKLGKDGKPSEANHGNVTPSLKGNHGGVTMDYALQTIVISLPALRRLRFPVDGESEDIKARTVLAALGLCGSVLSIEQGCDLRSRCLLIPESGGWEIVQSDGSMTSFTLKASEACELLNSAVEQATSTGLPWMSEPLKLIPNDDLAELVRRSRELKKASGEEE